MSAITEGLDPAQLQAVTAPRGPVCVLAGAGTGKTRTITRRIAALIDGGQVNPSQVLAVTFTSRAAAEMRDRLRTLGVIGPTGAVAAQTFHAAALRQLRYFWPQVMGEMRWELMDTKFPMVRRAMGETGLDTADRELVRDLAGEIEWAKSCLHGPSGYAEASAGRDLPLPAETVARVFAAYENGKVSPAGDRLLDFEDLIIYTAEILKSAPAVAEEFRSRYRSFVVDEYQDVTPVQQDLLRAWLGGRDDLTVVGDANQTIYSFTGASPDYLIGFTRDYPDATLVRLERDYRSTPQVVGLANAVIGRARGRVAGSRLALVGQRPDGPEPVFAEYPDEQAEAVGVGAEIRRLMRSGVPAEQIAVLYRINAASEVFEEELSGAGIPCRLHGAVGFFERPEIVAGLRRLTALADGPPPPMPPAEAVRHALRPIGLTDDEPRGRNERGRWQQLRRLADLAADLAAAQPSAGFAEVVAGLADRARNPQPADRQGVTLASIHAAKGLEWDAVLLTGLHEGAMPLSRARTAEEIEEERRLLYVGITRAREHLHLSWSLARSAGQSATRGRSRFLDGLVTGTAGDVDDGPDPRVLKALLAWRTDYARDNELREANVCSRRLLADLATSLPQTPAELAAVSGMVPERIDAFGAELLSVIASRRETAGRK